MDRKVENRLMIFGGVGLGAIASPLLSFAFIVLAVWIEGEEDPAMPPMWSLIPMAVILLIGPIAGGSIVAYLLHKKSRSGA